ncbi:MAG: Phytochrome, two-component sensor histidine kinase, partial [Candidatus Eremiobacteraeota bacterium]|nr:Phytochrome, two-component sensor histidine kinase [Candidatus Eremiobacteraeota bacterium]
MPAIVYVARPDGTVSFVNEAWERFSGVPVGTVLDHGWGDVLHPNDAGWVSASWLHARTADEPFREEFRIRDRSGEYRWVISHAIPAFGSNGEVACWYGTVIPIDERRTAEQALASLSDAIPQLVWANDPNGEAVHVNRRWLEYTGLSLEESLGSGWMTALHPDDAENVAARWRDAPSSGTVAEEPYRLRRHDGVYRWFIVHAVAVRDENGAIVRWYGTNTDVDDAYRAAQRRAILDRLGTAFAESLEFERTARTVAAAMCEDFADFAFVDVFDNGGMLERVAVESGRLTDDPAPFKQWAPPPEAVGHPINAVLLGGKPLIVPVCDDEWRRATTWSEGHLAFISSLPIASIAYVPMIAAGERIGVLTFGSAIGTGRSFSPADLDDAEEVARRAAVALANARLYRDLAASESRYRGIIDTAQEGVWIIDAAQRTRYVNPRLSEILGYGPDDMYGRSLYDFMPADARDVARHALSENQRGQGFRGESALIHQDGRLIWVMIASNPLYDLAGMYGGSLAMLTDITQRKEIETQYRVLARASDVLSGSLDLDVLIGRFADLLVAELAGEATIELGPDRAVVRRSAELGPGARRLRVPLRHRDVELGWVTVQRTGPFGHGDVTLLEELAARASVAIENALLYEREHRVAVTLQRAMLPAVLPDVEGLMFDAVYFPGATEAEIGGDWYDAIALADGRVVVSIGDVTGRGLTAAVIMGRMRQAIETLATYESDPVRLLDAADRVLRRTHRDAIVTALVGVVDPVARTMTYATAGHPTPMVRATGATVRQLPGRGLPLGLREGRQPPATTVVLPESALVVFFTDGLVESTRDIAEGERRVVEALHDPAVWDGRTPAALLVTRVLPDGARDDVAVLTMRVSAAPSAATNWTLRWSFDPRDVSGA